MQNYYQAREFLTELYLPAIRDDAPELLFTNDRDKALASASTVAESIHRFAHASKGMAVSSGETVSGAFLGKREYTAPQFARSLAGILEACGGAAQHADIEDELAIIDPIVNAAAEVALHASAPNEFTSMLNDSWQPVLEAALPLLDAEDPRKAKAQALVQQMSEQGAVLGRAASKIDAGVTLSAGSAHPLL